MSPRPRRPAVDWAILPVLRVEPATLAEMEAAAAEMGITLSAWRRIAYRAAIKRRSQS